MIGFNLEDSYIVSKMKKAVFLDIETSLLDARVYRTGTQTIVANQLSNTTRLLTAAWGNMYDLYTQKEKGVWAVGNHLDPKKFAKNPLDDTVVLEHLWDVLDEADVVIAHNARFDYGWIMGRFVQLGWPLPSKFSTICTYRALSRYNFTSKKLDQLARQLVNAQKLNTNFDLWVRCSQGEFKAFEEMLEYNIGDVFETLFKVYLRTCQYYPDYCVDMVDYSMEQPQCKVTGELLVPLDAVWLDRRNNCEYQLYKNETLNIVYRDRYNVNSRKSGIGLIKHHI